MRTIAILPVKSFNAAKQRLAGLLGAGSRQALAQATESAGGMTGMPWLGSDLGEYLATQLESSPLAVSQS